VLWRWAIFLFVGALKGNLEGGLFSGDLDRYANRALEMEHLSLCRDSIREPGGTGFSPGDLERYTKRVMGVEHRSLCRGSIRGTWRGFLVWGLQRICKEGAGGGTSLHRGSVRGTWRRSFFSGDFERYVNRALEMEHLSLCRGSVQGTCRWLLF
jgi:hypothetical protein